MTLRDLTEKQRVKLEAAGDKHFDDWKKRTNNGRVFGSDNVCLDNKTIFQSAFSKGVQSVLSMIEQIYENKQQKTRTTRPSKTGK